MSDTKKSQPVELRKLGKFYLKLMSIMSEPVYKQIEGQDILPVILIGLRMKMLEFD